MRETAELLRAIGRAAGDAAGLEREITVSGSELPEVMRAFKSLGDFSLFDIDAVDRPEAYHLAYRLLDRGGEGRVGPFTVRTSVDKPGAGEREPSLPSIAGVWKAADVLEREVWDLMGVNFEGRGEMKRILCKDDFEGHPLRKDFIVKKAPR